MDSTKQKHMELANPPFEPSSAYVLQLQLLDMDNLIQRPNTSMSKDIMITFFQEPWLLGCGRMISQPLVGNTLVDGVDAPK
jgi:hypothetical protein